MKITGVLMDLLVKITPEVYGPFVVFWNGKTVLYVQVLQALYGMLYTFLLWWKKFSSNLKSIGFVANPYDCCREVIGRPCRSGSQRIGKFGGLATARPARAKFSAQLSAPSLAGQLARRGWQ